MSFNGFQRRPISRARFGLVTLEAEADSSRVRDAGGFQPGGPEDRQMSSCHQIPFSITVSSNHSERRHMMKGQRGGMNR